MAIANTIAIQISRLGLPREREREMTEHVLAAILNGGVRSGEEEEKVSIGKYVEGALYVSSSSRLGFGVNPHVPAPQSLYHSWTFWFDTPSLKIKQSAWGSSMRKAHTIGTVEEFWR